MEQVSQHIRITLDEAKFLHELLNHKGLAFPLDKCRVASDTGTTLEHGIKSLDPNYRTDNSPQGR